MNQKRFAGFAIALFGMLISFSRIAITGAVIGVENSSLAGIAGAAIVFMGIIFILASYKRTNKNTK
ncbi:MAG TPA: hypothetical protein VI544_01020 [Candidatus Nanoarchaeia archaeon]|nr:hypothetical protein [Candidatus Nanoarchaeia archaeon]